MKMLMILTLILGCSVFSVSSFADGGVSKILESSNVNQSAKKKKRRKKVQMCHECGKPETECDCEGEGHGVNDENNHKDGEH